MFALFEKALAPTAANRSEPPAGLLAFYWHYARQAKGLFSINGVDMNPPEKTIENGKKLVEYRARLTADAIRKAIGGAP